VEIAFVGIVEEAESKPSRGGCRGFRVGGSDQTNPPPFLFSVRVRRCAWLESKGKPQLPGNSEDQENREERPGE